MPAISQNSAGLAAQGTNVQVIALVASATVAATDISNAIGDACYAMTNAGATTLTIPPSATFALPIGFRIHVVQGATGNCTITAGSGVTLAGAAALVAATTGRTCIHGPVLNTWQLL